MLLAAIYPKKWILGVGEIATVQNPLLGISPQRLNDVFTGRRNTQPTGDQVLHLLELIKTKPKVKKPKRPES